MNLYCNVFHIVKRFHNPFKDTSLVSVYRVIVHKHIFNVHGSVQHNNILVYKSQQDAQVTEFIFV
jgi:hypothetical protein